MNGKQSYFIEGERLYLRKVALDDVGDRYCQWLNDPEVNRYLEIRHFPQTLESIRKYVEKRQENTDEIFLAICLRENNQHIGNIKLGPINWIHQFADISLFIGEKECWGKGYATEVIKILSHYAFHKLNLRKLTAGCYSNNIGSIKAFKNADFTEEAVFKKHYFCNGEYVDRICLALFRAS